MNLSDIVSEILKSIHSNILSIFIDNRQNNNLYAIIPC